MGVRWACEFSPILNGEIRNQSWNISRKTRKSHWNTKNFTCNFFAKSIYEGETPIWRMKTCGKNLSKRLRLVFEFLVLSLHSPFGVHWSNYTNSVRYTFHKSLRRTPKLFGMSNLFWQNQNQILSYHLFFSRYRVLLKNPKKNLGLDQKAALYL